MMKIEEQRLMGPNPDLVLLLPREGTEYQNWLQARNQNNDLFYRAMRWESGGGPPQSTTLARKYAGPSLFGVAHLGESAFEMGPFTLFTDFTDCYSEFLKIKAVEARPANVGIAMTTNLLGEEGGLAKSGRPLTPTLSPKGAREKQKMSYE